MQSDLEMYYGLRLRLNLATVNSDDSRLDGGSAQTGLYVGGVITRIRTKHTDAVGSP